MRRDVMADTIFGSYVVCTLTPTGPDRHPIDRPAFDKRADECGRRILRKFGGVACEAYSVEMMDEAEKIASDFGFTTIFPVERAMAEVHLAGHRHDTSRCPICKADKAGYERGYSAAIKMVAEG